MYAKPGGTAAVSSLIDAMTWRYLDLEMRAWTIIPISTWLRGS
jgi:hypothetical protein